jgi:polyphosphate glucokinase
MQALGSYHGGRMLFLGLGTGLGSAMVTHGVPDAMEIAHLTYKKGKSYEQYVSANALRRLGKKKWSQNVTEIVNQLTQALDADYVVLGGGNAELLKELPPNTVLGNNENAFLGGYRLWEDPNDLAKMVVKLRTGGKARAKLMVRSTV